MTKTTETEPETPEQRQILALAKMREPFAENQISILPKQMVRDDKNRMACSPENGRRVSGDGRFCGGYHARSIHLDYVGHAALTDRLLEADPLWFWEPLALGQDGLPTFDKQGGLWIRLTVAGMSRLGYGDAQGKTGPNATKEAIGDALRNAGMRFGAALDLWHKGDLHEAKVEQGSPEGAETPQEGAGGANQSRPIDPAQTSAEDIVKANEWISQAESMLTADQVLEVYQAARKAGVLGLAVTIGGKATTIRDFLKARGAKLRAEEDARAAGPGEIQPDVLDQPSWATGGYTESDLV